MVRSAGTKNRGATMVAERPTINEKFRYLAVAVESSENTIITKIK